MVKIYKSLYAQVILAILLGIIIGFFYPEFAAKLKPLGDGFIKLVKMMIAPVIFCTIVSGIAGMQNVKKVGRVGIKAIIYFEVITTLALIIGLIVINILKPGVGMNIDPSTLDTKSVTAYVTQATSTPLTLSHQITMLLVLLLVSKGAAGVTGSGFIILAALLPTIGNIPVASIALILGIDRFISEARAITNLIGNSVATVVVAKWEKDMDLEIAKKEIG